MISNIVFEQLDASGAHEDRPNAFGASSMLWVWGQFLDHDFNRTLAGGEIANIAVPADDPVFTTPIGFNRATVAPGTGADAPRAYRNAVTAFIDGSNIYGSTAATADAVRARDPGTGAVTAKLVLDASGLIVFGPTGAVTGDGRAAENIALSSMHAVFHRLHNLIVDELAASNPVLTVEQLFDGARARVEAIMQAITYNEFLPTLLGPDPLPAYTGFKSAVSPAIALEFSGAIFRLGHTLLSPTITRVDERGAVIPEGNVALRDAFLRPDLLNQSGVDPLLRGMSTTRAQAFDTFVVEDVRSFLTLVPTRPGGFDLAALNIQRGRDLGLSSYNDTRAALGLARKTSFAEVTSIPEIAARLAAAYASVNDIDLWVGMLAEDPVGAGMVGELARAVLIDQFVRLRDGDPFWSEGRGFSGAELSALWSMRLSDVVKAVTGVGDIQDNMFRAFSRGGGGDGADSLTGDGDSNLLLGGGGNDILRGLGGDDHLIGGAGDDLLEGGEGDDTLEGGEGADTMEGGPGSDLFRIDVSALGATVLRDYGAGDRLEFKGLSGAPIPTAVEGPGGTTVSFGAATILFAGLGLDELPEIPGLDVGIVTHRVLARVGGTGTTALPPRFEVIIDGVSFGQFAVPAPVATFNVANDALFSDFAFNVIGAAPRRVDIVFLNDGFSGSINRDLVVDYIEVNGARFETERFAVSLFTNAEGPQAITGREHQFRNGTMRFDNLPVTSPGNSAPVIAPVANVAVNEGQTAAFAVSALDLDGDTITLGAQVMNRATGLALDPSRWSFTDAGGGAGAFSFVTGFSDAGVYDVTVSASDGLATATRTVAVTVADVAATEIHRVLARVGGTGTAALPPRFEVIVDGVSLGQFAVPAPVATFNVANDALFSDFVFEVAGPAPRRVDLVFLNDGVSSGINRDLVVDYIEVNGVRFETEQAAVSLFTTAEGPQAIAGREHQFRNGTMRFDNLPETTGQKAPVIDEIAPVTVTEGQSASFAVTARDPDGDPVALTATVTNRATGATLDPARYVFTDAGGGAASFAFATGFRDAGVYDVQVRADDGALSATRTVAVTVVDAPSTVLARIGGTGTAALPPQFDVRINGDSFGRFSVANPVATFNVANDSLFDDFVFTVSNGKPERVEITFVNDGVSSGVNRDLFVDFIEVDGRRFETEIFAVSQFTSAEGLQTVTGREGQFRNGTMLFDDLPVV